MIEPHWTVYDWLWSLNKDRYIQIVRYAGLDFCQMIETALFFKQDGLDSRKKKDEVISRSLPLF